MSITFGKIQITGADPERMLTEWSRRFGHIWQALVCDIAGIRHHAKRAEAIERRMNDSGYCERHNVSSEDRTEAQERIQLLRGSILWRTDRMAGTVRMFPGFWSAQPEGASAWLRQEWWAYAETDDVIEWIGHEPLTDPVWQSVAAAFNERERPCNPIPCPY